MKRRRYPFGTMQVGDSHFIAAAHYGVVANRVRAAAHDWMKHHPGTKFRCLHDTMYGKQAIRIVRVA